MSLFSIQLKDSPIIWDYMKGVDHRLRENNFLKNPFRGSVKRVRRGVYTFRISPIWPPIYWIGIVLGVSMFYFAGFTRWLVIPGIILSSGLLWTSSFYYFVNKLGLRKAGYKGEISRIKDHELVELLVFGEK